uniref:TetR/AcrR family transcriptional regulator n=1 Tax=Streptomyces sp. NBC_00003 TaxID=2903608 RepID=A0AAU2UY17_9ACTN
MSPRRTNAERTEATRAQLTRTARELFSERGYSSTTIAEIAERCGLTTGALYHHWAGKEALLVDIVHDIHLELAVRIRAVGVENEPVAQLLLSGREFIAFCADPAVARLLLLDAPAVLGYERWRRIDEQWWLSTTIRLVERARATATGTGLGGDGTEAGPESSRQLALALLGALTYLGHEVATKGGPAVAGAGWTYEVLLNSLFR